MIKSLRPQSRSEGSSDQARIFHTVTDQPSLTCANHHLFHSSHSARCFNLLLKLCCYIRLGKANVCWAWAGRELIRPTLIRQTAGWLAKISAARFCHRRPDYDWSVWYSVARVPADRTSRRRSWCRRLTTGTRSSGQQCFTLVVTVSVAKILTCARIRRYRWVRSISRSGYLACWQYVRKCQRRCRGLGSYFLIFLRGYLVLLTKWLLELCCRLLKTVCRLTGLLKY